MNAILTKDQNVFIITIETSDGKAMLCLRFDTWLSGSCTMGYMSRSSDIETVEDKTEEGANFRLTGRL